MYGPLAFACLLIIAAPSQNVAKGKMTFYAVAVGQGDSAIIQCPNNRDLVIVDMGAVHPKIQNSNYVTTLLKKKFNAAGSGTNIHVVVTHPHADHYNLFSKVLDSDILPNVRSFILGGKWNEYNKKFRNWLYNYLKKKVHTINDGEKCFGNSECKLTPISTDVTAAFWTKVKTQVWKVKDPWQFCTGNVDVNFTILGANIGSEENGKSVILKIQYKSWSMLMSGDFEQVASQKKLIEHYKSKSMLDIFKASYYKVAHHGAWTEKKANIPDLLRLIQPEKVYISHGHPSLTTYHHPSSGTINNLKAISSIAHINPQTNAPFVYWDQGNDTLVVLKFGLDWAIYETCPSIINNNQQVCHDIEITTDGKTDSTKYISDPNTLVIEMLKRLLYY